MFVAASTECFPDLAPDEVTERLVDLEFTAVELALHERGGWLAPSAVAADPERALNLCRQTHRLDIAALSLQIEATGEAYYEQFTACTKLAKALKVATLVTPSSELGTPFNEEIERLRKLAAIASLEGCVVALKTQIGRMSQDPDNAAVFCDHAKGLRLTLDPSAFVAGPHQGRSYDKVMPLVQHIHLRDSTKQKFHVRVGQGEIDYGKLIGQLEAVGYHRALVVNITPLEGFDHNSELRKVRLLLESLL